MNPEEWKHYVDAWRSALAAFRPQAMDGIGLRSTSESRWLAKRLRQRNEEYPLDLLTKEIEKLFEVRKLQSVSTACRQTVCFVAAESKLRKFAISVEVVLSEHQLDTVVRWHGDKVPEEFSDIEHDMLKAARTFVHSVPAFQP